MFLYALKYVSFVIGGTICRSAVVKWAPGKAVEWASRLLTYDFINDILLLTLSVTQVVGSLNGWVITSSELGRLWKEMPVTGRIVRVGECGHCWYRMIENSRSAKFEV